MHCLVFAGSTEGLRKRTQAQESVVKKQETQANEPRETSSKPKVTDSTGKRSASEAVAGGVTATAVQDSGVSSTEQATSAADAPATDPAPSSTVSPPQTPSSGSETDASEPFEVIKKEDTQ